MLLAYARRNPRVGYVQGMGFVAALLLVFIDEPEEAFWCFAAIIELLLPQDFYSATLLGLRAEQAVLNELVASKLPRVAKQLHKHGVIAELFATRWFVALFANSLPIETTLRVWDAFLLEGTKVLHRVGLALLRVAEPRLLACTDQQELLCTLQDEQAGCLDCERLMSLAFDRQSFLRSFPRGRIHALRRRHRARLLVAEGQLQQRYSEETTVGAHRSASELSREPGARRDACGDGVGTGGSSRTSASTSRAASGGTHLVSVTVDGVEWNLGASDASAAGRSPRSTLLPADMQGSSDEEQGDESFESCDDAGYEILSADDLPPRRSSSWV